MKAITSNVVKNLEIGSELNCADNSGAKLLKIVAIKSKKGVRRRRVKSGIGDKVVVRVLKGDQKLKGELYDAVIIRQRKEFRRINGVRVRFEDNAAVLLDENGLTLGNKIKGVVSKEVIERYSNIGKIATIVA